MALMHLSECRKPAVAGFFYPEEAEELSTTVDSLIREAKWSRVEDDQPPFAIIVPHAGYVYSAPVAAPAYALLPRFKEQINRVLLIGPAHRIAFRGIASPSVGRFSTPIGDVQLDGDAMMALSRLPQVVIRDDAHAQEHSLEVQLPFLQRALDRFDLIPLVVGLASADEVAEVISVMTAEPGTVVVISSDLSHYLDSEAARRLDRQTVDAILALDGQAITDEGACGRSPIKGLLKVARVLDLKPELLDLRNSGDTAGTKDRVVGYASLVFRRTATGGLRRAERETLLHVAQSAIRRGLAEGAPPTIEAGGYAPALAQQGASFVTLKKKGRLRGCIGSLIAHRPLVVDVAQNAFAAAFNDPRFGPLTDDEFASISTLEISVLTAPKALAAGTLAELSAALRPGLDGLIVRDGGRRATFLPQVWQQLPDRSSFLQHLWHKAGLAPEHWSPGVELWRYQTQSFATTPDKW
jgi:AmmeMemoRadiSam system protein B/AmmeMemoRadiSam system protein A